MPSGGGSQFSIATLVLIFVFFIFLVPFATYLFQGLFDVFNTAVNESVEYPNSTIVVTVGNSTQVVNSPTYYSTPFSLFYAVIDFLTPLFTNPIYLAMLLGVSVAIIVMASRKG